MRVHREGKRGRAALIGEGAQHGGKLVDAGATAAEFHRYAGLEQSGRTQGGDVVGDEIVLVGRVIGAASEQDGEFLSNVGDAAVFGRIELNGCV